jgi:hypothetical protein
MDRLHEVEMVATTEKLENTKITGAVYQILAAAGAAPRQVFEHPAAGGRINVEARLAAVPSAHVETNARWLLDRFAQAESEWLMAGSRVCIGLPTGEPRDAFELLGIPYREDSYTALLAWAFRRSSTFREGLLRALGIDAVAKDWTCCVRPTVLRSGVQPTGARSKAVPDLVLSSRATRALIVIENKVLAGEGHQQTNDYADPKLLDHLARDLAVKRSITRLVYLTLDGDAPSHAADDVESFVPMTYDELAKWLPGKGGSLATDLLVNLRQRIEEATQWPAPADTSQVHSYLATHFGLATGMRVFRKLCAVIAPSRHIFPESGDGKYNNARGQGFYAQWSAPGWNRLARGDTGGDSIHLELQYEADQEHLVLRLHHEPLPYVKHRDLKKEHAMYEAHMRRRAALDRRIAGHKAALASSGWHFRRDKWSLASAKFDRDGLTVASLQKQIEGLTLAVARALGAC